MELNRLLEVLRPHLAEEQKLEEGILAAVMVVIHMQNDTPYILLTKRSNHLRKHAGEISCPGGTYLDTDRDLLHTAIRETYEELGIRIEEKDVVGYLKGVHTLTSNFTIVPYVALVEDVGIPEPNNQEIDAIIDVPLLDLLKTVERDMEHANFGEVYRFVYDGNIVWGATARILKQIYDILRQSGIV